MTNRGKTLRRIAETFEAASMISWALVLGPLGVVAGMGLVYARMAHNPAVGILCGMVLLSPLAMILAWAAFAWRASVQEERSEALVTGSPVGP